MSYIVNLDGFEDQKITVEVSYWTGPKLFINGVRAQKGIKRGEMILQRSDSTHAVARWKQGLLGLDVPQLIVDGKVVMLVEPLKWYEYVWAGLPVLLVFIGGALGGLIGASAYVLNIKVFRLTMNYFLKYVVTTGVFVLAFVVYVAAALFVSSLIGR